MVDVKKIQTMFDEVSLSDNAQVVYDLVHEHDGILTSLFNSYSDVDKDAAIERAKQIRLALNAAMEA